MIQKILSIVAIFSDILTILSVWGISSESPLWLKILITVISIIIGVVMLVLTHDAYDIKVKSYHYKEEQNEFRVYTKKNKFLIDGSIVSIYYKYKEHEEEHDELVALGYVFVDENALDVQIKVFNMINERLVRNILASNRSCKKYHIRPSVDFSRVSQIVMNERGDA